MNSLFIAKESVIHSLDPRTKILFVIFVVISSFILSDPALQLLFLAAMFPLVLMSKLVKQYFVSMQFLMFFVVMIMTVHGIYNPIGETPIWHLFGGLSFKYESLVYASVMSFRILVIGTAAVLFVMTTHPSDLASALLKWKVPHSVAFILLSTFQIIPIIMREAKIIMEAQQARCLDVKSNLLERFKHLVPLFAPLFITTFMKVHQLSYVLECRAFSAKGKKTSLRETKISWPDYMIMAVMVIALVFEFFLVTNSISLTSSSLLILSVITVWTVCALLLAKVAIKKISSVVKEGA